jgi:hypothetical protein
MIITTLLLPLGHIPFICLDLVAEHRRVQERNAAFEKFSSDTNIF